MDQEVLDFLEHYGVKGQKWGVRRQLSGTKTNKPKSGNSGAFKEGDPRANYGHKPGSAKGKKRMSDSELQNAIKRMELEKRYSELSKSSVTQKGERLSSKIMKKAGEQGAQTVANSLMTYAMKQLVRGVTHQVLGKSRGEQIYKEIFPKKK